MNFPKKQLRFFIIICFISLNLGAQVPTSTFRTHLNYEVARGVSVSQNFVYVITENGFYRKSKSENVTELLDKRNGLSEMNVTTSAYQVTDNQLLIGYESGTIDVIT
ncbi:MAG: hypothetical protein NWQ46_10630, partial [Spirosomaceae bacterium]|nr:hypothetical protein [Spirosomataceae bacterium]